MEPKYHTGDVAIAVKSPSGYKAGDIVVYLAKVNNTSGFIIHQIINQNPDGTYVLKGINKADRDPWDVPAENIRGKVRVLIPQGQRYVGLLQSRWVTAGIVGLMITAMFWPTKKPADDEDPDLEASGAVAAGGPPQPNHATGPRHRRPPS